LVRIAKRIFLTIEFKKLCQPTKANKRLWDLMNYIKKCKLPATEAIKFSRCLCNELENLWQTLYQSFNSAQDRPINFQLLDEISLYYQLEWPLFSKAKFIDTISKYSSLSVP